MAFSKQKIRDYFSARKIILPMLLSLGVIGYMLYSTYAPVQFQMLLQANLFWLGLAIAALLIRDAGYIYRIRYITNKLLSWKQSFHVIMLWELASCALPSAMGSSAVAAYILYKEKIPLGKSIAQVMVTSMLDNLYFVLAVPLVLCFTSASVLPEMVGLSESVREAIGIAFFVSYLLIALYAFTIFYALFINPQAVKHLLIRVGQFKPFRRWREAMHRHANELLVSSKHLRSKGAPYWLHAGAATALVWTARYIIIGCLIAAFTQLSLHDHLVIFSQNLIYKIVLFVSIPLGAAGVAELAFPAFFGAFLGSFTTIVVLLFRMLTHYLYLVMGIFIFPRWAGRVFKTYDLGEEDAAPVLIAESSTPKQLTV